MHRLFAEIKKVTPIQKALNVSLTVLSKMTSFALDALNTTQANNSTSTQISSTVDETAPNKTAISSPLPPLDTGAALSKNQAIGLVIGLVALFLVCYCCVTSNHPDPNPRPRPRP